MKRLNTTLFALIIVGYSACGRSGIDQSSFDQSDVEKLIHVGMSRAEVIAKFGKPLQEFQNADGSTRMIYLGSSIISPGAKPLHYVGFQLILKEDKVVKYMPVQGRTY